MISEQQQQQQVDVLRSVPPEMGVLLRTIFKLEIEVAQKDIEIESLKKEINHQDERINFLHGDLTKIQNEFKHYMTEDKIGDK